jgi:hypothetical protein
MRQTIRFWNFMGAVGVTYFCFYNYDKYLEWAARRKKEWVRASRGVRAQSRLRANAELEYTALLTLRCALVLPPFRPPRGAQDVKNSQMQRAKQHAMQLLEADSSH